MPPLSIKRVELKMLAGIVYEAIERVPRGKV
jgi:hypothetical protein